MIFVVMLLKTEVKDSVIILLSIPASLGNKMHFRTNSVDYNYNATYHGNCRNETTANKNEISQTAIMNWYSMP